MNLYIIESNNNFSGSIKNFRDIIRGKLYKINLLSRFLNTFLFLLITISHTIFAQPTHSSEVVNSKKELVRMDKNSNKILVRIGDKIITVKEFYERAEYTVRPAYAKNNSNIEKKIILNSLIAEKLMVLESGDNSQIIYDENYKNIIQGRKEQKMRELLWRDEGYAKVKLDSAKFMKQYQLAGRTYDVGFINITDADEANYVHSLIENKKLTFEEIYYGLSGNINVPKRQINWNAQDTKAVSELLFNSDTVYVNQIFGPLKLDNSILFLKIYGWNDRPAVTTNDQTLRFNNVKSKMVMEKGGEEFTKFIKTVMKGKKLDFNPETFEKMVNFYGPYFHRTKEQMDQDFLKNTIDKQNEIVQKELQLENNINSILDEPFLNIDGQVWTVETFENERKIHPLVFRKKNISKKNFSEQFKLAIVDLITNKYLAAVALERGYDKDTYVVNNINMWSDAIISLYEQTNLVNASHSKDLFSYGNIDTLYKPYINELQKKYSDQIEINAEEFKKIKLTRVDFFAYEENVPYPILVPAFPMITNDYILDYGKELKEK